MYFYMLLLILESECKIHFFRIKIDPHSFVTNKKVNLLHVRISQRNRNKF